jgi:hypothetical protein
MGICISNELPGDIIHCQSIDHTWNSKRLELRRIIFNEETDLGVNSIMGGN